MASSTAGFGFIAWRRSGFNRWMGLLELLRVGLVACGAVLLNQPEWVEEFRPEERPAVAVLYDASPSMETRDVLRSDKPGAASTRRDAITPLIEPSSWSRLREKMDVVVQPGQSATVVLIAPPAGHYPLSCADHDWDGMLGQIDVR